MFPLLWPMLIGAGGGALLSKKDPLKGALLGAGLGAGGAAFAPGLLGGLGAAAPATAASVAAPSASTLAAVNLPASTSMFPEASAFLSQADKYMRPISTGLSVANNAGLLGGQQQPIQQSPVMQNTGMGGSSLAQLYGQLQQNDMNQQQAEMQRRAKQRELIARMGGNYGRIA